MVADTKLINIEWGSSHLLAPQMPFAELICMWPTNALGRLQRKHSVPWFDSSTNSFYVARKSKCRSYTQHWMYSVSPPLTQQRSESNGLPFYRSINCLIFYNTILKLILWSIGTRYEKCEEAQSFMDNRISENNTAFLNCFAVWKIILFDLLSITSFLFLVHIYVKHKFMYYYSRLLQQF